jgi:hypothetical protein
MGKLDLYQQKERDGRSIPVWKVHIGYRLPFLEKGKRKKVV